eukprot:182938-Chlamydomonas_euryale.AAC.1
MAPSVVRRPAASWETGAGAELEASPPAPAPTCAATRTPGRPEAASRAAPPGFAWLLRLAAGLAAARALAVDAVQLHVPTVGLRALVSVHAHAQACVHVRAHARARMHGHERARAYCSCAGMHSHATMPQPAMHAWAVARTLHAYAQRCMDWCMNGCMGG